jgi:cytidyltransferase-like protein
MDIVIVSGYFDPLHSGHLELIKKAKELGDELWVIVNNDEQAKLKKGKSFMTQNERIKIMNSLKYVDKVFLSIDKDRSVCKSLKTLKKLHPEHNFIFANGGDVTNETCREYEICKELGIKMVDKLGEKIQSSSWLTGIK